MANIYMRKNIHQTILGKKIKTKELDTRNFKSNIRTEIFFMNI